MLIIPAIDLLGGRAVRLEQGDFARVTDFGDPLELARRYADGGASWLHVVDLDGAREGGWRHLDVIADIVKAGVPVQAGGGARDVAQVEAAADNEADSDLFRRVMRAHDAGEAVVISDPNRRMA